MRYLLVTTLAALAAAGAALADPAPAPQPAPPPRLFLSPSGEPFRLGPTDPDPLKAWFDQADAGHLGYIDRAEFRADALRFFKKLDENNDGVVDGFELADYENKIVPELTMLAEGRAPGQINGGRPGDHGHGGPGEGGGHGGPAGGHGAAPQSRAIAQLINEPEPVSGADYNLDDHITLDEWMRATDQRFDLLDTDKSGRLTLAALRARLAPPPPKKR
jgi:hypothetical protein